MQKRTILILAAVLAVSLLSGALADSLTLEGTTVAAAAINVYAPIGGTVGEVRAEAGQTVAVGDTLFSFVTDKVYAEADGTVTGVFGQPGDAASSVASRYGAVLYIEEDCVFSVAASTDNAYNSTQTKFVHVGESVWLQCKSNTRRVGRGVITAVNGTNYTVQVTQGSFIPGDTVYCYRSAAYANTLKIGQGTVSRINPTAVTASGSIVRIAVANGDQVHRGDLLLETLNGDFAGLYMTGTDVTAPAAGVLGSLSASAGSSVQGGASVAVIWETGTMRVEALVPEDFRGEIHEGDRVRIELASNESVTYEGTVVLVSAVAASGGEGTAYRVLADFTPDERVTFGMSVLLTTLTEDAEDAGAPEEDAEDAEAPEDPEAGAGAADGRTRTGGGRNPQGGRNGTGTEGADGDADD